LGTPKLSIAILFGRVTRSRWGVAMSDDPLLQEQLAIAGEHFAALVRQVYEIGKRAGENEARAKVLMVFGVDGPVSQIPDDAKQKHNTSQLTAAAKVSGPLREAVVAMKIDHGGADTREITIFINQNPGPSRMTEAQVRSGLKALKARGDVVLVARGRYRPSDQLEREFFSRGSDAEPETPNSSELSGVPMANGTEPLHPGRQSDERILQ
jgi:hypothetical protein